MGKSISTLSFNELEVAGWFCTLVSVPPAFHMALEISGVRAAPGSHPQPGSIPGTKGSGRAGGRGSSGGCAWKEIMKKNNINICILFY